MYKYYTFLLVLFAIISCTTSVPGKYDALLKKYQSDPADSIRRDALHFLVNEISDQTSEQPFLWKINGIDTFEIIIDSLTKLPNSLAAISRLNLVSGTQWVNDRDIIDTYRLEQEMISAVSLWNKYPWSKGVPKDIFLEYLLPYKVHAEYPDNWREHLTKATDTFINRWQAEYRNHPDDSKFTNSNEFYFDLIVNTASRWFGYGPDALKIAGSPSFSELLLSPVGGCKKGSFFCAYVLRSAGIPATVDIVPYWGSQNGTHASEVYWNSQERRMTPGPGRKFHPAAKVFRLTFNNQFSWTKGIKPFVNENDFLLNDLRNDYWKDVTGEHNVTSDIHVPVFVPLQAPAFAYICVYNFNNWVPLFWGRVDKGDAIFKNMGRNILYRIAVPTFSGFDYAGEIFLLDSSGKVQVFNPDLQRKQTMTLSKLNTGNEMWVKKNTAYTLYLLSAQNEWDKVSVQVCTRDSSIVFDNVPVGGLYRLVKTRGPGELERIFAYTNGQQVWY